MTRTTLATIALAVLAGCAATAVPRTGGGPAKLGQTAYIDGPRVRPDRVIEDSRCPMNARCVWAGRFILRATVFGGSWSKQLDLTLGKPAPVADGALTLTSVTPDRVAGAKARKPRPYRFTFQFQGGL